MSIKNIYVNFFKYLRKPVHKKKLNSQANLKTFFCLFLLAMIIDFSLDWVSMNHWLIEMLNIKNANSQNEEVYREGFWFAILTVAILAPTLEELVQRSYLTSFYWNNYLAPINISFIIVILFNIRGNILFIIFGISLLISRIIFLQLKKNQKLKLFFLKFYSKNYFSYFYLSAISFGVAHITNYQINNFIPILPILLVLSQIFAGLMLGYVRISMGLRWCICFHILHNLIFLLIVFLNHVYL